MHPMMMKELLEIKLFDDGQLHKIILLLSCCYNIHALVKNASNHHFRNFSKYLGGFGSKE